MSLVSLRNYAKQRGVAIGAVQRALNSGRITLGPGGKIDPEQADRDWAENTRPRRASPDKVAQQAALESVNAELVGDGGAPIMLSSTDSFNRAHAALEVQKAHIAQLKRRQLEGSLVDKALTMNQMFGFARALRDSWLAWPSRVSAIMAADLQADPQKLHLALDAAVRQHLLDITEPIVGRGDETG